MSNNWKAKVLVHWLTESALNLVRSWVQFLLTPFLGETREPLTRVNIILECLKL